MCVCVVYYNRVGLSGLSGSLDHFLVGLSEANLDTLISENIQVFLKSYSWTDFMKYQYSLIKQSLIFQGHDHESSQPEYFSVANIVCSTNTNNQLTYTIL